MKLFEDTFNGYSFKNKHDRGIFVDDCLRILRENSIEYPIPVITEYDAKEDFKKLQCIRSASLLKKGKWIARKDYKYKFIDRYIEQTKTGNASSNYFHIKNRYLAESTSFGSSVIEKWNDDKYLKKALTAMVRLQNNFNLKNLQPLNTAFHLQFYVASQFRPSAAKCIYDIFDSKNVLDFSSGWGDRLSGFCSSKKTISYTGIDPNSNLIEGYNNQIKLYNVNKKINLICDGAEFVELPKNTYDTIFTSPPYFNCEKYSNDDKQSFNNYNNYDSWLDGFLYKVIDTCWSSLKIGGYLIINIADIDKNNILCDYMNDHISTLSDANYLGAIGYRISTRPNIGVDKHKVYCEPVWIWKKGDNKSPFDNNKKNSLF